MKILNIFTSSYPYGKGEPWLNDELPYLKKKFDQINIYPLHYGNSEIQRTLPIKDINVHTPIFENSHRWIVLKSFFQSIWFGNTLKILYHELFREKAAYDIRNIKMLIMAIGLGNYLKKNVSIFSVKNVLENRNDKPILYFYWGTGFIYVLPFIDINKFQAVYARFHRGDLYKYSHYGYLPFRKYIIERITKAIFISTDGLMYAKKEYGDYPNKYVIHRLGVKQCKKIAQASQDGIFRIVTCSFMVPVKRLHLLINALHQISGEIEWTHIGHGDLYEVLLQQANELPDNIQIKFLGFLSNDEVKRYYEENPVDLFINVSASEGVPVSIMEALSAGIPVMATDVGGTSEIVDEKVGILLPSKITGKELSKLITEFIHYPVEYKASMQNNAIQRFKEKCDVCKVYADFSALLG